MNNAFMIMATWMALTTTGCAQASRIMTTLAPALVDIAVDMCRYAAEEHREQIDARPRQWCRRPENIEPFLEVTEESSEEVVRKAGLE
jgi:hypothetical protein